MPPAVGADANRLQAQAVGARAAAGGHQQAVAAQLAAVREREHILVSVVPCGGGVLAEVKLDALGGEHLAERLTQRPRLAREHMVHALDDRHVGAHPPRRLGRLDPDRAGPEDE